MSDVTDRVRAVLPAECWVTRTDVFCTDFIGGTFPNGSKWVEEMCCLPCRVRAALDPQSAEDSRTPRKVVAGYPSSARAVGDLKPPPRAPAPGAPHSDGEVPA